jgi:transposase
VPWGEGQNLGSDVRRDAEASEQLQLFASGIGVTPSAGRQTQALVLQLDAACRAADDLAAAAGEAFAQHPDADIVTSFPGIGPLTGARVLGEIGDDRSRFRDARGLKSYAGSAPITVASGKNLVVHHRKVRNQRLAAAGYVWIFRGAALTAGEGALRPSPRGRRQARRGDAQPVHRFLGCLHHCLQTGQLFDPAEAFPSTANPTPAPIAA